LSPVLAELRDDRGDDLVEVADHGPVGARHDRCVLVLVDHEDPFRALATDDVLDRAADAARDVKVGGDPRARLPDLVGMRPPAEVCDDARPADGTAEELCELFEQLEPLLTADAAASADNNPRSVEPNGPGGRLLAPDDTDDKVLFAERWRELLHRRRHAGGPRLDRVWRDREELRGAGQIRLLEQAAAPTLPRESQCLALDLRLDDVRRQRSSEPSRDVCEHLVTPVGSWSDHDVRVELDDRLSPGLGRVLVETIVQHAARMRDVAVDVGLAEHHCLHVAEPGGKRERLERDRVVVDQAERHDPTSPRSRNTSTTRAPASAPPPMIST